MIQPGMTIKGLQEAQAAMNQIVAEMQPRGAYGKAIQFVTTQAHAYLVKITHVDTGAYRASQRMEIDLGAEPRGIIFVDPSATNPRSGERVEDYAIIEEARGGDHAAYNRTVTEIGDKVVKQAGAIIEGELPRGAR